MPTPILGFTTITTASTSKEVLISDTFAEIENAFNRGLVLDFSSANVTLTDTQWTRNIFFICSPVVGNRDLIVPLTVRFFAVRNDGTVGGTITVRGATGATVVLAQDEGAILFCNGTGVSLVVKSSGGGGGSGNPNDIGFFVPGIPPDGEIVARYQFTRNVEFDDDFSGSQASSEVASTGTAVFDVLKNGSSIGSVTFTNSDTGVFSTTGSGVESFSIGDILTVISPTPLDSTLESVSISFAGERV